MAVDNYCTLEYHNSSGGDYTETECGGTEDGYYVNVGNLKCMVVSPCAKNYRGSQNVSCANCLPEDCPDNCPLLPDLIVSPWMAVLGDAQTLVLDNNTLLLPINTGAANIGLGPLELENTDEFFCCNASNTVCNEATSLTICAEGLHLKRKIKQVIYKANANSTMAYEYGTEDAYVIHHAEHGHYHTENWIAASLRQRPTNTADPNYNEPLNWPEIGAYNKLSFCLIDGPNCISNKPFMGTNLTKNDIMTILNGYTGTFPKVWNDPTGSWWNDPNYLKNKRADFPNYFLGKGYGCGENNTQGMSPGFGDAYSSTTPGNSIMLPCDLADGLYYVVLQIDPLNLYQESNEDNNLAVIPVQIDMSETVAFSYEIIEGAELVHYQESGNPATQPEWTLDNRINGTIRVGAGYTLTIHDCILEFMTPESGIIVDKGGKLIVENSTLRGSDCFGNVWKGVQVLGTTNLPHDITDPDTQLSPNFGICILDHATIRDAKIGVATCGTTDPINYFTNTGQGLLISRNETIFENNEIGVYLAPFRPYSQSSISDTRFINSEPFADFSILKNPEGSLLNKPVGIYMKSSNMSNAFLRNTFESTLADMPTYGIGIINYNSRVTIGQGAAANANYFNNLYSAVEFNTTPSFNIKLDINGNTFGNNQKGITIVGSILSQIWNNTIQVANIPSSYGIYNKDASGFGIISNAISTDATANWNPIFGIVTENSSTTDYASEITENTFTGKFTIAQAFLKKNSSITIDCNAYIGSFCDWFLYPYATIQPQGNCLVNDARRNLFHTGITGYHIYNQSIATVGYTSQVGFSPNPSMCQGNVNIEEECASVTNPCATFLVGGDCDPDGIKTLLEEATTDEERIKLYTRLLYDRLCLGQKESALIDLSEEERNAAYKVLTATYTDNEQTAEAWAALLQIIPESGEDIDFYNTYEALLNGIDWTQGGGKTQSPEVTLLWQTAQNQYASNAALAQAIIGENTNTVFNIQTPIPVFKTTDSENANNQYLRITPNPAQGVIHLTAQLQPNSPYPLVCSLYDPLGRMVKTVTLVYGTASLSLADLPNGIYYCRLQQGNVAYSTQKITIIH